MEVWYQACPHAAKGSRAWFDMPAELLSDYPTPAEGMGSEYCRKAAERRPMQVMTAFHSLQDENFLLTLAAPT